MMTTTWVMLFLIGWANSQIIIPSSVQVRLVNGVDGVSGRVEVRRNSSEQWGTVCDDLWGDQDATVVCKMTGSRFGTGTRRASFGQGTGPIYMDNVQCRGSETNLAQCPFQGWRVHNCAHREDAGVVCTNQTVVLTAIRQPYSVRQTTPSKVGAVQIRTVNGLIPVCDTNWNDNAATVVCRMLGHTSGKARCCSQLSPFTATPNVSPRLAYTNFSCSGSEQNILSCSYNNASTCSNGHMASVTCYDKPLNQVNLDLFSVEIVNGSSDGSWGRVEVTYQEVRGQLCGASFNDTAASVICKQKGFQGGGVLLGAPSWAYYNTLPIWINSVNCTGQETSIKDCAVNSLGKVSTSCRPIHVLCSSQAGGSPTLRLVGGGRTYGRVQISYNNVTGTVCDKSWNDNDAKVVCKMLRFTDGTALTSSYYGPGSGPVYMDSMYCSGGEKTLWQCRSRKGWNSANSACNNHAKDASVACYKNVRLIKGDHSNGIVTISQRYRSYTRWLAICGYGFGRSDARVVCRELGFQKGRVLPRGAYGKYYSSPYIRKSMRCRGTERTILRCRYSRSSCNRLSYTGYASVHCYNGTLPTAKSISITGGVATVGNSSGRVIVQKYGIPNGRICNRFWDDRDANVVCRQKGFRGGVSYQYYFQATGPYLLSEVGCTGNESSIFNCSSGRESCAPIYNYLGDAGVLCYRRMVKLVGGVMNHNFSFGRVLYNKDGQWWPVCSTGFDALDAQVVCRELGFQYFKRLRDGAFGSFRFTRSISSVNCTGSETSIKNCTFSIGGCRRRYPYTNYGSVSCSRTPFTEGISSSVDSVFPSVVFIKKYGVSATVCTTGWDDRDARVLCREKGYSGGYAMGPSYYSSSRLPPKWFTSFNCTGYERRLSDCPYSQQPSSTCRSSSYMTAKVFCYNYNDALPGSRAGFQIRLVRPRGSPIGAGRVEMAVNGRWGTICDSSFSSNDARVVCKQLGFTDGRARPRNSAGAGTGPAWLYAVNCRGTEKAIWQCRMSGFNSTYSSCSRHRYDAAVQCSGNVRLRPNVTYGAIQVRTSMNRYSLICADNFTDIDANVICQEMGYSYGISICCSAFGRQSYPIAITNLQCTGQETRVLDCPQDTSLTLCPSMKYASAACSNTNPNSGYDLAIGSGSATSYYGVVKVSHMNIWGTMCPDGFDNKAARVICREKGFAGGFAYVFPHYHSYYVTDLRWLSNVRCDGTESYLQRCQGVVFGDTAVCRNFGDAAVYCYNNASLGLQFRLANKTGNSGRVEMAVDGVWGTICADYSFTGDANVLCKKLGYIGGRPAGSGRGTYGRGSGPVYISNMRCRGNETDVSQCVMNIKSRYSGSYCRQHRYDAAVSCYNDVRLVDTKTENYGRVEIQRNKQWVPVCDSNFDNNAARVTCKSMGFVDGRPMCCSALGSISISINVSIQRCAGDESSLTACQITTGCQSGKYATVYCSRLMISDTNRALVRMRPTRYTSTSYVSSIEINKYGFWGPVCDKTWTDADAKVTCKSLGWRGGITYITTVFSTSPMVINNVQCTGRERNISACTVTGFGATNIPCSYPMVRKRYYGTYTTSRKAAGVLCYNTGVTLRLADGGRNYGRIVITYDGTDGRVCNSYFDNTDATVVCRQLGYKSGVYSLSAYTYNYRTRRRGRVWVNYARCTGNETSLFQCQKTWYTNLRYSYCRDAGVICYNTVRLINGNQRSYGLVEANYNGNWGGICNTNWNAKDTQVACRDLGFQNGYYLCCGAVGNHYKPIFDNVRCTGSETSLVSCPHGVPTSRFCVGNNVGVACYNETAPTGLMWQLRGGNNYTGEVLVNFTGIAGRICPDGWDDTDATVACKELGFGKGKAYSHYKYTYYNANNGPYWTSNIACNGTENRLADCPRTQLGMVTQCQSSHSAGLMCFDNSGIYYRLAGGTDMSGRVELSFNGVWGSVCRSYFDNREANVLCRTLGYSDGVVEYRKRFGNATGPVYEARFQCTGKENQLSDCPHSGWKTATGYYCRNHRYDAAVSCYGMVRLGAGYQINSKQGPVQMYNNGSWSLVCDTGFTDASAKRVCRDLGFVDGKAICCSTYGTRYLRYYYYGQVATKITLNSTLSCQGDERSAVDCVTQNPCLSSDYVSVLCQNSSDVINERYSFDFDTANTNHGMIRVNHYGVNGRICNTFWGDEDAKAFCKKKGFPDGIAYHYSVTYNYLSFRNRGPFWVSAMNCTGVENGLSTCPYNTRVNLGNCSGADISSAICLNETSGIQYRLGGGGDNYGRVEISVGGVWGTVCDSYWDDREAGVLCRTLHYSDGYALKHAFYGKGSGPMWLSRLQCKGTETDIHKCPHSGFNGQVVDDSGYFYRYCQHHSVDASVYCVDTVRLNQGLNASQGAVEVYDDNQWKAVCDDGFDNDDAQVVCRSVGYVYGIAISGSKFGKTAGPIGIRNVNCVGNEVNFKKCTYTASAQCNHGTYASVICSNTSIVDRGWNITIVRDDPLAAYHGELSVNINGIWGSVCMANFGKTAANIACTELGYAGGVSYRAATSRTRSKRKVQSVILMTELVCTGNEASLKDCKYQSSTSKSWCNYYAPRAGVLCYKNKNYNIHYRLTGEKDRQDVGRVEMKYANQWGVFCELYTSYSSVARVACKSVGFKDGMYAPASRYKYHVDATHPHPPIWYYYIRCNGNESTITECLTDGFNNSVSIYSSYLSRYCRSRGPLSAQCYRQNLKLTDIRLVNPYTNATNAGRVEVFLQGPNAWGTVCDDLWDDVDATVVCNQLGFAKGVARHRAAFGKGKRIWMDNLGCKGTERRIQDCPFNGFGIHNCLNSEDAGVVCSGILPSTTSPLTGKPTGPTTESPVTAKHMSAPSKTPTAAIVVPVVLIILVAIAVAGFFVYRRITARKGELDCVDLVDQDQEENTTGVSFRKTGAFFSRKSEPPISTVESVANPAYDLMHADDAN